MYKLNFRTLRLRNPEDKKIRIVKQGELIEEREIPQPLLGKLLMTGKVSEIDADGEAKPKGKGKGKSKGKGKKGFER